MMAQVVRKDEPEVELTCRESQLLLETIPLDIVIDAEDSGLTQNQIMAVRHHVACNECLRIGLKLKDILGVPNVGCKEALEIWSGIQLGRSPLEFCGGTADTLRQRLALEHVFGRLVLGEDGAVRENFIDPCFSEECQSLRRFLGVHRNRIDIFAYEAYHAFLLELFYRKEWHLGQLFDAQEKVLGKMIDQSNTPTEKKIIAKKRVADIAWLVQWWNRYRCEPVTGIRQADYHSEFFWDMSPFKILGGMCGVPCGLNYSNDCSVGCHLIKGWMKGMNDFIEDRRRGVAVSKRFDSIFHPIKEVVVD